VFNPAERAKYFNVLWLNFGLSIIIGPVVGGAFSQYVDWRLSFLINLPIGAISVIFLWLFLDLPYERVPWAYVWDTMDLVGTTTFFLGMISFLAAINVGTTGGWATPAVYILFGLYFAFTLFFLAWEICVARTPMIPFRLIFGRDRTTLLMFLSIFFRAMSFAFILLYGPFFFQAVHGDDAVVAGLELLPTLAGLVLFTFVSAHTFPLMPSRKFHVLGGNVVSCVGFAVLSLLDDQAPRGAVYMALLWIGAGLGFSMQHGMNIIQGQHRLNVKEAATVSSLANVAATFGACLGITINGCILIESLKFEWAKLPLDAGVGGGVLMTPNLVELPLSVLRNYDASIWGPIVASYVTSFQRAFKAAAAFELVGCLCTLAIPRVQANAAVFGFATTTGGRTPRHYTPGGLVGFMASVPAASLGSGYPMPSGYHQPLPGTYRSSSQSVAAGGVWR
jgi:hypothetical protein